jgi:quercetin dioxygenase-like cupin family protein
MIDLNIKHHFIGGVYAKEMIFPKNSGGAQHKHVFDHMSILAQGKVKLMVDGKVSIIEAPAVIEIKKNTVHRVVALEECRWYCIHATDITDPDKVDEPLIIRD